MMKKVILLFLSVGSMSLLAMDRGCGDNYSDQSESFRQILWDLNNLVSEPVVVVPVDPVRFDSEDKAALGDKRRNRIIELVRAGRSVDEAKKIANAEIAAKKLQVKKERRKSALKRKKK